jgi:hypothetical protein
MDYRKRGRLTSEVRLGLALQPHLDRRTIEGYPSNMQVPFEIPDADYRKLQAQASLKGQSIPDFLLEVVQEKLSFEGGEPSDVVGWQAAFGTASPEEMAEFQAIIDREFSQIDLEDWS